MNCPKDKHDQSAMDSVMLCTDCDREDTATRNTAVDLLCALKRVTAGASTFAEQREVWQRVNEFLAQFTPGTEPKK